MSRREHELEPSKKELARKTLAAMVALSKTAGMETDSSRESSPEYRVGPEPPAAPSRSSASRMVVDQGASQAQGRGSSALNKRSYTAAEGPAASSQPNRSRAPSFLDPDTPDDLRGLPQRDRGLPPVQEEGEEGQDDAAGRGAKISRAEPLLPPPAARSDSHQRQGSAVPVAPAPARRSASRSKQPAAKPKAAQNKLLTSPFEPGVKVYESRGVSPSTGPGPSIGWHRNQIAEGVLQAEPAAAGGGPAPVQIDKTRETQVVASAKESMTGKQMHEAFEERLGSMDKRDELYFADAANEFVGVRVIYGDHQVSFPLSAGFRKKLPVFRSIVNDMEILLTYPRSALINILIVAKKERMLTETWRAKQWLHDNINTVWGNVVFCSKFTEHGVPALHSYVIGKCLVRQEKISHRMIDLDFLPLSDVGRAELETNLRNIRQSILKLNRHITSAYKEAKAGDEESLFDSAAAKQIASKTDDLVNNVLSALGSKGKKPGKIEEVVHGFTIKFVATATVSAVLLVIAGAVALDRSEIVRTKLIELFTSEGFKKTLGTGFSISCSQGIATFIGEIAQRTGTVLKLSAEQTEYVYHAITDAITHIRGVEPVAGRGTRAKQLELAFDNFAKWSEFVEQGALTSRALDAAGFDSQEETWEWQEEQGAEEMRKEELDSMAWLPLLTGEKDNNKRTTKKSGYEPDEEDEEEDEEDEEEEEEEMETSKGKKGGKRTTKRSKVTKKRKQKKTKTVKRKRRITKKK